MRTYKLEDIFRFAINLEEHGRKFYEILSGLSKKEEIKNLFVYLSKAETKHAKIFQRLYKKYSKGEVSFGVYEHSEEFLDTILREILFPDISEIKNIFNKNDKRDIILVIKSAMDIETNTIIFYTEISGFIEEPYVKEALSRIIKEEKNHLVRLKNFRLDLDPLYAGLRYGKFF